jgi:thioredoxin reductase (NADPH)
MIKHDTSGILDIAAVGAGPSALCALWAAKRAELSAVAFDKGPVCGALVSHPTYMRWFSTAEKLELPGLPLLVDEKNPTRREYLKYCRAYVRHHDLNIATYTEVTAVRREGDIFHLATQDLNGRSEEYRARNVIMATGFYGSPRPLNVPGEDLPKVSHRYRESHWYSDHEVLVIGAGSSAAEVALELWREEAQVTVAMRGDRFHTKYWIEPDIENRIQEGSIRCYRDVEVEEIRPDDVVLRNAAGKRIVVENDFVLAMTGYEPDTSDLRGLGAEVDDETNKPILSDQYETTVPGLYVAGTLCAGVDANVIFIENSRHHGPTIVDHILSKQSAEV